MRFGLCSLAIIVALLMWQLVCVQPAKASTELFLDDYVVQGMSGLTRTMHQPVKYGPVIVPDVLSDGQMIQTRSAPMWDPTEQVYKLVYIAYTWDNFSTIGMAMAISTDGINWTKPNLGQEISVYGSTANNRITPKPGSTWGDNCMECVVVDPCDPDPSRRFKSLVGAVPRYLYVSPDCIHWTYTHVTLASQDEANLTFDQKRGQFLAILKSGNQYGRASNIAISYDFTNWTTPRLLFGADATDQVLAIDNINAKLADDGLAHPVYVDPQGTPGTWKAESYNTAVFPYAGVYIGMPMIYHPTGYDAAHTNTDGFDLIQLMMTRNLINWTRLGNRQPFIPPSRIGSWSNRVGLTGVFDRIQMAATNPLEMGDELWFYYCGMKWRDSPYGPYPQGWYYPGAGTLTDEEKADLREGHGAICLAKLRRDGFVSLDAGPGSGSYVLLKPRILNGTTIRLNLDASAGQARVEILNQNGQAIAGFSYQDCVPLTSNAISAPVQWTGANLSQLTGQTVQFKIYLNNASLYSLTADLGEELFMLTVQVNPGGIGTVTPAIGTHGYSAGEVATISAKPRYVNCPDIYVFDHWEGDVTEPTAPTTTVAMDANKTVTAVFVACSKCRDCDIVEDGMLFKDDFENNMMVSAVAWPDASGDYDPDNPTVGSWFIEESASSDVQVSRYVGGVQPTAAHSGNNYLISGYHYDTYGNWSHPGVPAAVIAPVTDAVIDFWFWGKTDMIDYVCALDGAFSNGVVYVRMSGSGEIAYYSGGWQNITSTWTAGNWNHMVIDISCSTESFGITVNDQLREGIGRYGPGVNVGNVRFYADYTGYYDDIRISKVVAGVDLTMVASPDTVGTVTPPAGTHRYAQSTVVPISANRYVNCPDVYVFDHWVGDVADADLATTTVVMDVSKTITAVYSVGGECGDECHLKPIGDLDGDCRVNMTDLAFFARDWLTCTSPECD